MTQTMSTDKGLEGAVIAPHGLYLGWFDPDRHRPARLKLAEALARYRRRYDREPCIALVNPAQLADVGEVAGVRIEPAANVAANTFFVGETLVAL